jgi:hypothetical protein
VTAKQLNKFPIDYSWWQFKKQLENGSVTGCCTLCFKYQLDKCQFNRSCRAVVWDGNDLFTHTTSLTHKVAVTAKANPLKRAFDVVRTTGIVAAKTATQCLMATALTCIKEQLPISKFAPLLALEKFLGVDQIAHKYNHSRYVHDAMLAQGIRGWQVSLALKTHLCDCVMHAAKIMNNKVVVLPEHCTCSRQQLVHCCQHMPISCPLQSVYDVLSLDLCTICRYFWSVLFSYSEVLL